LQTLQSFTEILPEKKGIEKSLWVKKFIKKIEYSKEEIAISLYYRENPGEEIIASDAGGCPHPATGKGKHSDYPKEIPVLLERVAPLFD